MGPGSQQQTPVMPAPPAPGQPPRAPFEPMPFWSVPGGVFIDPPLAQGFRFEATGTAKFNQIMSFPAGLGDTYRVIADGTDLGTFSAVESVDLVALLGHGATNFEVRGIQP